MERKRERGEAVVEGQARVVRQRGKVETPDAADVELLRSILPTT